jgi:hypothetical protein
VKGSNKKSKSGRRNNIFVRILRDDSVPSHGNLTVDLNDPTTMDIIGISVYGDTFDANNFFKASINGVPCRIFFPPVLNNILNQIDTNIVDSEVNFFKLIINIKMSYNILK